MLIFQAGGERTTVPRWDSSSYLRCCAWITVVKKGQFMIHKTNIKCDIGLGLGGESCGVLTWYYFINNYSSAQVFRFESVGLFLSEFLSFLPKVWFVSVNSLGQCGKLALSSMSSLASLSSLLSFFFPFRGKPCVSPHKGAAGLSLTLMFIPAVGWNNCELYFPLCGTEQRLVLLIIEVIQRLSTTFLSWNNKVNSMASWELNLIGA